MREKQDAPLLIKTTPSMKRKIEAYAVADGRTAAGFIRHVLSQYFQYAENGNGQAQAQ
jgi:hypothetical protein